jgi:prepilin peptidase CpaA
MGIVTAAALLAFPLLLLLAATFDVTTMTIPNRLNTMIALLFLPAAVTAGFGVWDLAFHLLTAGAVIALCFGMFALNLIGGGDAKLAAAISVWLDPWLVLQWVLWSAVYGGALTIIILLFRMLPLRTFVARSPWLAQLHNWKSGVPYGVALAAAGLHLYPHTLVFAGLGGWPALAAYIPH